MELRTVIIYVALMAVVLVAVLYLNGLFSGTGTGRYTTTVGQSQTTSILNYTNTANSTTVTIKPINYSACVSGNDTAILPNGNFGTGTFADWTVSGSGFGLAPVNLSYQNNNGLYYGSPWSGYSGDFAATTFQGGSALKAGNLTSNVFIVNEPYLNFKIVSAESGVLYVELLSKGRVVYVAHYDTVNLTNLGANTTNENVSTFMDASIPLVTALCEPAQVRVVAGITTAGPKSSGNGRFIAVGDFYLSRNPVADPSIIVNQTLS